MTRSKWTAAKALYLASRYFGVVMLLVLLQGELPTVLLVSAPLMWRCTDLGGSQLDFLGEAPERKPAQIRSSPTSHCRRRLHLRVASIIGSLTEFGMVNVITALRIYALYGQSKCVLYLVVTLWVLQLTAGVCAIQRILHDYAYILSAIAGDCSTCEALDGVRIFIKRNSSHGTSFTHMSALAICIFTSTIHLIMTLVKLRDSITDSGGKVRYELLKEMSCVTPIAGVFISDGALSLILYRTLHCRLLPGKRDVLLLPYMALTFELAGPTRSSPMCLILNLRRAGGRGTPTLIVQRQDETLEWDVMRFGGGTEESGRVENRRLSGQRQRPEAAQTPRSAGSTGIITSSQSGLGELAESNYCLVVAVTGYLAKYSKSGGPPRSALFLGPD
ncbi:hypothetical protein FA13DRAFT_1779001 [Coprinellus micaceus]|uniref:Uncharacterized protein n=1 Tax=Coprinellus micaceus TaxID=71717 RepID=A0A4Y7SJ73_COPMI|nr:hypothetical protein FA13DRAFT_1779001 [Coprinellus micaceus]